MSVSATDLADGVVLTGSQFSEPTRVVGNPTAGDGFVLVNLVGKDANCFDRVWFKEAVEVVDIRLTPPAPPKPTLVVWESELKREQRNLFSLKVLTRLAESDDLQIDVKLKATLKEGQTTEQLNSALKELGIDDSFKRDP